MIRVLDTTNENDFNYNPLVYDKPLVDTTGAVALPLSFITGLYIVSDISDWKITGLTRTGPDVAVSFNHDQGTVYLTTAPSQQLLDSMAESVLYVFDIGIQPECIISNKGVTEIATDSVDTITSATLEVVDGYNIRTSLIDGVLTVHAVKGAGAGVYCGDADVPEHSDCAKGVYTLASVPADDKGNITLVAGPGMSIENVPEEHKIIITTNIQGCSRCRG